MKRNIFILTALISATTATASSGGESGGNEMVHLMANLVMQLGFIIFAAFLGGRLFKMLRLPSVLGEVVAGIVIGHSLLGSIPIPGFPLGLFPISSDQALSISPELYGFSTIAAIILLFYAGLETDLAMLIKFSVTGILVGIGGAVFSFSLGAWVGTIMLDTTFADPRCLFLGIIATATSVGITVRILSEKRKLDSPEGVTIIAAAVLDDVIGIILLAIVAGATIVAPGAEDRGDRWGTVIAVALKAVSVWLGFTVLGLILAHKISGFLKKVGDIGVISVLALGLALLLAGVFEKAGLAMIIGAYVMGLTLSKTDLKYVVQDALEPLYKFFVPVFFTITGMLVDIGELLSLEVLVFGGIYTIAAITGKVVGCGVPALFLNFNRIGALRIGLGMSPRVEVAIIIAGIGLSYGILDDTIFGVAVVMTLITTVTTPLLLSASLTKRKGTRKEVNTEEKVITSFNFESPELTRMLETHALDYFQSEGYFVHHLTTDHDVYHMRQRSTFITFHRYEQSISFETTPDDVPFVKTIIYETLVQLSNLIEKVRHLAKPETLAKDLVIAGVKTKVHLGKALDPRCIIMHLKGEQKEEIITELIDCLDRHGKLTDRKLALQAVLDREETMSTGMQNGIALPHGKTDGALGLAIAVGLKKEGVDFQSLDGQASQVFFLVVSPLHTTGPHIQFLAEIGSLFSTPEVKDRLLECRTSREVHGFLSKR